jgi:hypothetical protein
MIGWEGTAPTFSHTVKVYASGLFVRFRFMRQTGLVLLASCFLKVPVPP